MAGDLVSGGYPLTPALRALLGTANAYQGNQYGRSNFEFGVGNLSDGAMAATGVGIFVPVPVDQGETISAVTFFTGATAGATMTHQFAAVYSGAATPALLGQSTDTTSAAITAKTAITYTLSSPVSTAGYAPNGFVYALIAITATTVPTALSVATPAGVNYQWTTKGPLYLAGTAGSALAGTAAATIASPAAAAVGPVVLLT